MFRRLVIAALLLFPFVTVSAQDKDKKFTGHTNTVYKIAFSPDKKVMATAGFDDVIKLWDYASGKELKTLKGHGGPVYCVVYSPDGKTLASSSQDKTIRLWNPEDGKMIREIKGHTDIVSVVAYSPDGKTLASAGSDKSVRLWNPDDGKEIKKLGDHKGSVYDLAFSPDGKLLASASNDASIKIWDVDAKKEVRELRAVVKSKDDKKKDDKGKKADKKGKKDKKGDKKGKDVKKDAPKKELEFGVLEVAFSPDGKQIYSGGFGRYLRVWNTADGKKLKKLGPLPEDIYGIAVRKDGKVATAGYGGNLQLWDIEAGKSIFKHDLPKGVITFTVVFSPDEQALVTGNLSIQQQKQLGAVTVTPIK